MNIDGLRVFKDKDITFAQLPDPAALDDMTLGLWELMVMNIYKPTRVVKEAGPAADRFYEWLTRLWNECIDRWPDGNSPIRSGEALVNRARAHPGEPA
jgi:hypothetical protein